MGFSKLSKTAGETGVGLANPAHAAGKSVVPLRLGKPAQNSGAPLSGGIFLPRAGTRLARPATDPGAGD